MKAVGIHMFQWMGSDKYHTIPGVHVSVISHTLFVICDVPRQGVLFMTQSFIYYLHLVQSEVSTDHGLYVIICLNDGYVSHRPYFVGRSIMPVSYLRSIVNMIFRLPYHWYY